VERQIPRASYLGIVDYGTQIVGGIRVPFAKCGRGENDKGPTYAGLSQLNRLFHRCDSEAPRVKLFQRMCYRYGTESVGIRLNHREQRGTPGSHLHGARVGYQIGEVDFNPSPTPT
jgi:hypothetical protein